MNITTIGIDLAKVVFRFTAWTNADRTVLRKSAEARGHADGYWRTYRRA